jgi:uroporphyrinogen III methyltransferase / synthase
MSTFGKVYLVGAGPGHAGLISLRGVECLKLADVVLYDGLVNPLLLRHSKAHCERTCRSPSPSGRVLQQAEINQRLVESAQQGKTVVRLKGGDPFIFGRGSEEAAFLREHGVEFEIVPGITAATAAGEFAGLSLTHRDHASMVTFVTGHEAPGKSGSSLDYALLAQLPGTLVFYMGLHRLPEIANTLVSNSKSPDTPAAVISKASTPFQRTVTGSLGELADKVSKAELHAPSLIIIGDCVSQREELKWFEDKPLFGQSIGITRPDAQADVQIASAYDLGAEPVVMPTISIRPAADLTKLHAEFDQIGEYDWIVFTSANGVDVFFNQLMESGRDVRCLGNCKVAAIGSSTAENLREFSIRADLVPTEFRAEALAEALKPLVADKRILWPRANRGRDVLPQELRAAGATLNEVVVYENDDVDQWDEETLFHIKSLDWIGLSSPSIARNLARLLPESAKSRLGKTLRLASISPVTTAAAQAAGLVISAEAATYTWDGIFEAIVATTPS